MIYDVLNYLSKLALQYGIWDCSDFYNFSLVCPNRTIPKELIPLYLEYNASLGNLEEFIKYKSRVDISRDRRDLIREALDKNQVNLLKKYYIYWDIPSGNYSPFLTAIKYGQLEIVQLAPLVSSCMVIHAINLERLKILRVFKGRTEFTIETLLHACLTCNFPIIEFLLNTGIHANMQCILMTLENAKITRMVLQHAQLSRLAVSCLISRCREYGFQESEGVLIEFKNQRFPH